MSSVKRWLVMVSILLLESCSSSRLVCPLKVDSANLAQARERERSGMPVGVCGTKEICTIYRTDFSLLAILWGVGGLCQRGREKD